MKHLRILLLVCLTLSFLTSGAQKKKHVKIHGHVTYTHIYKGGAKPTEEILQSCCQPMPFANRKLYIKTNYYSRPLKIIQTDSNGNYRTCIRKGAYNIYINNEVNPESEKELVDGKMKEKEWLTSPYAVIKTDEQESHEINFALKERINTEILPP
jgi:hypothetical protein